ncbi:hypothetical protein IFR05_013741 [Cadophora sp. M221]|nr:hypothetical protein IFR05_013741 [Cadophora sp. M221]
MKSYNEIDLSESPIVVLGCGHFFTAETLDGMIGMAEVYGIDGYGEFTGFKDPSSELSKSIPKCPDCNCAIRQHTTQRYNRVINRAWPGSLRDLDSKIEELDQKLENSRARILEILDKSSKSRAGQLTIADQTEIKKILTDNNVKAVSITGAVTRFRHSTADRNQPAQKLHDATVYAAREASAMDGQMAGLTMYPGIPRPTSDRRVTLGGFAADLKSLSVILSSLFSLVQALHSNPTGSSFKVPGGNPALLHTSSLRDCRTVIRDCTYANLPKLAVEVTCYFGNTTRALQMYSNAVKVDIDKSNETVQEAVGLLENAKDLCTQPFKGADILEKAVDNILGLLGKERYEEVAAEELAAIKQAMVSGYGGIATHSGHWYKCENGHPFAIGECGMPMERARCPECGAMIGGQHHRAVDGVTRATEME